MKRVFASVLAGASSVCNREEEIVVTVDLDRQDPHIHALLPSALIERDDWPRDDDGDYERSRRIGDALDFLTVYRRVVVDRYADVLELKRLAPFQISADGRPGRWTVYEYVEPPAPAKQAS